MIIFYCDNDNIVLLFEQRSRVIPYPEEVFAPLQKRRIRIRRYVRVHVVFSQPRRGILRCVSERRFRFQHGLLDVRLIIVCAFDRKYNIFVMIMSIIIIFFFWKSQADTFQLINYC